MTSAHFAVDAIFGLSALLALGWLWQAVAALRGMPTLPDLTRDEFLQDDAALRSDRPEVTVIVPACNEGASIQTTLRSLLASTGVRLQIVAVDDRSTDSTGALIDAVAAEAQSAGGPHTLQVIHNRELPPGWLGKVHALALGAERAQAPWLLFTDGDVRFSPSAVGRTLRYAANTSADHVVLLLTLDFRSFAEGAVFAAFQALSGWGLRLWKVADPKARDCFGAGGFNMLRREVFDQLGGFDSLRMEVVEDLRLGWMIKRAGYASRIVLGPGLAHIRWIHGALGIVGLLEKNGFAALRYRIGMAFVASLGLAVQILLPPMAMLVGGWAAVAGVLIYLFIGSTYYANRRVTQVSPWAVLLFAAATGVVLFALVRSVVLTLWRGGVIWRGTRYSLAELRRCAGGW